MLASVVHLLQNFIRLFWMRLRGQKIVAFAPIIITSQGGFFCAGGDLNALIERRSLPEPERREKVELLHDVIRAVRACSVPVIAAVKGGAAGAGASIALACDFIVMEAGAKFTAGPMSKLDWYQMAD